MSKVILAFLVGLALSFLIEELRYAKPDAQDCRWVRCADPFLPYDEDDEEDDAIACSVCGKVALMDACDYVKSPYCPFCGSKMANGDMT